METPQPTDTFTELIAAAVEQEKNNPNPDLNIRHRRRIAWLQQGSTILGLITGAFLASVFLMWVML